MSDHNFKSHLHVITRLPFTYEYEVISGYCNVYCQRDKNKLHVHVIINMFMLNINCNIHVVLLFVYNAVKI